MPSKKILTFIMALVICSAIALAIPKPDNPADPFKSHQTLSMYGESTLPALDISASPNSLMGSECSNLYKTTGDYCSGHIRIYYQCLPTMDGAEWQQRSENCGDYPGGGRCVEWDGRAECVDYAGTTPYGTKLLLWGISLILLGALAGFFVHPIFFVLVIIGIWVLFKMMVGGV